MANKTLTVQVHRLTQAIKQAEKRLDKNPSMDAAIHLQTLKNKKRKLVAEIRDSFELVSEG